MSFKDRENIILDYLRQNREASIDELCAKLFVSAPTMRRDLKALATSGKIIRTTGGAIFNATALEGTLQQVREKEFVLEKDNIAKKCLDLIHESDTIMVDGSSSCLQLLKILDIKSPLIVITNSSKASAIFAKTGIKTFVTGGEASKTSFAYVGTLAEEFIRKFNADICFFSVCALSPNGTLSNNSTSENQIGKIMLEQSKKAVLLLNSQKVIEPKLNTLCTLKDVDLVVSEKDISHLFPEHKEKFI